MRGEIFKYSLGWVHFHQILDAINPKELFYLFDIAYKLHLVHLLQYVPLDVMIKRGLKLASRITIQGLNGKTWQAKVVVWKDGTYWIGAGWRAFCKHNKVTFDDTCIVEFLKVQGQYGTHVRVQIIRAKLKTPHEQKIL